MKKKHVALIVVLSVVLSAVSAPASDKKEVLIAFPRSAVGVTQHGNLLVVVHFPKDDKNRAGDLVWESPDGEYGRSLAEINSGNDGVPIVKDLVLSSGEYVFIVTLHKSDGSKISTTRTKFVAR